MFDSKPLRILMPNEAIVCDWFLRLVGLPSMTFLEFGYEKLTTLSARLNLPRGLRPKQAQGRPPKTPHVRTAKRLTVPDGILKNHYTLSTPKSNGD